MKDTIAIIGATGFLGQGLKKYLNQVGYEVLSLSRKGEIQLDITNKELFSKLEIKPTIVINCASMLPGGDFWDEKHLRTIFETNFWGSYNLANWIKDTPSIEYVLNLSTLAVVNKPWPISLDESVSTYPYSSHQGYCISKLNQELVFNTLSLSTNVKVCNARLSALFGEEMEWNGVMSYFIDKAIHKEPLDITNGDLVSADFLHRTLACKMIEKLIINRAEGIINLASGKEVFLKELAFDIYTYLDVDKSLITNNNLSNIKENRSVINIEKIKKYFSEDVILDYKQGLFSTIEYRKKMILD